MAKISKSLQSIGKLAKRSGLSAATLRYYEKLGLIKSQRTGLRSARHFPPSAAQILEAISRFQDMGFTLREVRDLLQLPENHKAHARKFSLMLRAKLAEVERELDKERQKKRLLALALKRSASGSARCLCDLGPLLGRA